MLAATGMQMLVIALLADMLKNQFRVLQRLMSSEKKET